MIRELQLLSLGRVRDGRTIATFRKEQGDALSKIGVKVEYFNIEGHGIAAYLKSMRKLFSLINCQHFDIIHAHYGLSGLLSVIQMKVKVVITFHGSDIWNRYVRKISLLASYLSDWNIFVSKVQRDTSIGFRSKKSCVLPCGIDLEIFQPLDQVSCRKKLGLDTEKKYVLFASGFTNKSKKVNTTGITEFKEVNNDVNFYSKDFTPLLTMDGTLLYSENPTRPVGEVTVKVENKDGTFSSDNG